MNTVENVDTSLNSRIDCMGCAAPLIAVFADVAVIVSTTVPLVVFQQWSLSKGSGFVEMADAKDAAKEI